MSMKKFFKKHKAQIIVGSGALVAGILSFFITLNVYPTINEPDTINEQKFASQSSGTHTDMNSEEDTIIAQIINDSLRESENIGENTNIITLVEENETDKKEKIDDRNTIVTEEINLDNVEIVNEEINENAIIEAIAIKKDDEKCINDFDYPTSGDIILEFAKDKLVFSETLNEWITHDGIDIRAEAASPVKASESGIVESVKMDPRYGNTIIIRHDENYKTIYSNLSTLELVYPGKMVGKGDIISGVGEGFGFEYKEGPHVHFEILYNGEHCTK